MQYQTTLVFSVEVFSLEVFSNLGVVLELNNNFQGSYRNLR